MATAQEWIEAAYARSTANDPGKTAIDSELLLVVNRIYQAVFALAAAGAPSNFLSRTSVTLAAGVGSLPTDVIDVRRVQTAGGIKVHLFPIEDIDRLHVLAPAVFRQGNAIVSRGQPGDPGPSDALSLWIVGAPTALTVLSTAISSLFPVRYHNLCIVKLAMYLSAKDEGRAASEYAALKAEFDAEWKGFIITAGLSNTALESPHLANMMKRFYDFTAGGKS